MTGAARKRLLARPPYALTAAAVFAALGAADASAGTKHRRAHAKAGMANQNQSAYGKTGARGRMGLGANPRAPEGPGNPSTR
ncbi:hypothetical protein [Methylocella sp.]|uniref:hypothetical protein n=1 Tax=Methylocella sp. TaxID=1978226 RepID=UPI0037847C1D